MGDKRKKKRTTKKTSWEEIKSWVTAVLCVAIIVVIASYVAKLVPGSSAQIPSPVINPTNGTPAPSPTPTRIAFGKPIQITGLLTDPAEFEFSSHIEYATDSDGNFVLFYYVDFDTLSRRIFIYHIKTRSIEEIVPPFALLHTGFGNQKIYGDKVVFENDGNIYLYDMSQTPPETVAITNDISQDPCDREPNIQPDIYGDWVVWAHGTCVGQAITHNIYAKNIKTGEMRQLDPTNHLQWFPRIFENKIVWEDHRHAYIPRSQERYSKCVNISTGRICRDVYLYDLETREIKRLTPDYSSHTAPNVYKNLIVWYDDRNYDWDYSHRDNQYKKDIFVYDMQTNQITNVIALPELKDYEGVRSGFVPGIWESLVSYAADIALYPEKIFLYDTLTNKNYEPGKRYILPQTQRSQPILGGWYPNFNIVWTQYGESRLPNIYNLYMIQAKVLA